MSIADEALLTRPDVEPRWPGPSWAWTWGGTASPDPPPPRQVR